LPTHLLNLDGRGKDRLLELGCLIRNHRSGVIFKLRLGVFLLLLLGTVLLLTEVLKTADEPGG
jgi:hypothetical protein